ncbi:hypothetical protein EDD18DRAFT_1078862, partial [Armillaria luteobubalina]
VTFETMLSNVLVFILELKSPEALRLISSRGEADGQIRRRISDLCGKSCCPSNFIVYTSSNYTAYCLIPRRRRLSPSLFLAMSDNAREKRWDYGVLDDVGERKFCSIVEEIKKICAKLF